MQDFIISICVYNYIRIQFIKFLVGTREYFIYIIIFIYISFSDAYLNPPQQTCNSCLDIYMVSKDTNEF